VSIPRPPAKITPAHLTLAAVMVASALLGANPAQAALVYSNGGPDFSGARVSDTDLPAQGADLFSVPGDPAAPTIVTRLRFWGSYLGGPVPAEDHFTFALMRHTNISFVLFQRDFTAAEVERSAAPVGHWTDFDALGQPTQVPVFEYEVAVAFALVPDLPYYLSFTHHSETDSADWLWAFSGGGDGMALWRHHQAWWVDHPNDYAFELIGPGGDAAPVDEPAAAWLAALGALALARRRRKRFLNPSSKGPLTMKKTLTRSLTTLLASTVLLAAVPAAKALPAVQRHGVELPAVQSGWMDLLMSRLRASLAG